MSGYDEMMRQVAYERRHASACRRVGEPDAVAQYEAVANRIEANARSPAWWRQKANNERSYAKDGGWYRKGRPDERRRTHEENAARYDAEADRLEATGATHDH